MKVKSFIIACSVFAMSAASAYAQKGELNSAKNNYAKFEQLKGAGTVALGMPSLTEAKASIDKATTNDKTKDDPSAWAYKALIYGNLSLLDTVEAKSAPLYTEAVSSLQKAREMDKEGANKTLIEGTQRILAQYELNKGVKAFSAKNYSDAYNAFNKGLDYLPGDTIMNYYAGLAAINSKDYDKAIQHYNNLTSTNFSQGKQVFLDLSRLYAAKGDTTAAIKAASEGAAKFPDDKELPKQEIELSLLSGKQKEVIDKITAQAQKEPDNKTYPYYLGLAYNTLKDYPKAEEAYKKAIAIDPQYYDANVNLGSIYLNTGIDIYNQANKLPTSKQKEYDALMKKAQAEFDKAFPYLQKATEIQPDSEMALKNLKTYYVLKKNQAKVDELTKKIDALK